MLKYFTNVLGCPKGITRICVRREAQYSAGEGDKEDKYEIKEYDATAQPARRFKDVQTSQQAQAQLEAQSGPALAGENGEGKDGKNSNEQIVTSNSNSNNNNNNHTTNYTNSETLQGTNGNGNGVYSYGYGYGYGADEEALCSPPQPGCDVKIPLTFTYSNDSIPLIGILAWPFAGGKHLQRATSASSLPKTFGGSDQAYHNGRATESADDVGSKLAMPSFALNETSSKMARRIESDNGGAMQGDTGLDFDFAVAG